MGKEELLILLIIIKLLPAGRVWLVTSRLGTRKSLTFFLQCMVESKGRGAGGRRGENMSAEAVTARYFPLLITGGSLL